MKILLDTNIIIHREASNIDNKDIGIMFRWLDNLHYTKCVHPLTVEEIKKHQDPRVRKSFEIKLENYYILKTIAPLSEEVSQILGSIDKDQNSLNDTSIINELYNGRVDALIIEDRGLLKKAFLLNISDKVFTIDEFLESNLSTRPLLWSLT